MEMEYHEAKEAYGSKFLGSLLYRRQLTDVNSADAAIAGCHFDTISSFRMEVSDADVSVTRVNKSKSTSTSIISSGNNPR